MSETKEVWYKQHQTKFYMLSKSYFEANGIDTDDEEVMKPYIDLYKYLDIYLAYYFGLHEDHKLGTVVKSTLTDLDFKPIDPKDLELDLFKYIGIYFQCLEHMRIHEVSDYKIYEDMSNFNQGKETLPEIARAFLDFMMELAEKEPNRISEMPKKL